MLIFCIKLVWMFSFFLSFVFTDGFILAFQGNNIIIAISSTELKILHFTIEDTWVFKNGIIEERKKEWLDAFIKKFSFGCSEYSISPTDHISSIMRSTTTWHENRRMDCEVGLFTVGIIVYKLVFFGFFKWIFSLRVDFWFELFENFLHNITFVLQKYKWNIKMINYIN